MPHLIRLRLRIILKLKVTIKTTSVTAMVWIPPVITSVIILTKRRIKFNLMTPPRQERGRKRLKTTHHCLRESPHPAQTENLLSLGRIIWKRPPLWLLHPRISNSLRIIGAKLEAQDPRSQMACDATVIGVQGPRVRLQLERPDTKNDFCKMVDYSELHEIGYCKWHFYFSFHSF